MEHHSVVGIIESGPRDSEDNPGSRLKIFLTNLKLRIRGIDYLKDIASTTNTPYMYLSRQTRSNLPDFARKVTPDIICVASLSQLLKKEVLRIPPHGSINLHPSLLPKYRGAFPWFWQYHAFEKEWGITVHFLDEGEDTGPILRQEAFHLEVGTDIFEAMKKVSPIGARLMLEAVNDIEKGVAVLKAQPPHDHPRARVISRSEKLIDWENWPLERVWHVMRGTYPWLDAVEYPKDLYGRWKVGEMERCAAQGEPGTLCKDDEGHYIAHEEGRIRLILKRSLLDRIRQTLRNLRHR